MRAALLLPLLLTACSGTIDAPSLERRPYERPFPADPVDPPRSAGPRDGALDARAQALLAQAREGNAGFGRALERNRATIARGAAAPVNSDAWVEGQMARSSVIAARTRTSKAVADLDALRQEAAAKGVDDSAIAAALAEAQALLDRQERLD